MNKLNSENTNLFYNTYKAELVLLFVTISWGLSFPLMKFSLKYISPGLFLFIRFFITLVFFIIVFRNRLSFSSYNLWKKGFLIGIFLFLGFTLQTLGLEYTSATKSAFITASCIIFIPFIQYLFFKIKPASENLFGGILVLIGLCILSEAFIASVNNGDVLTVFCALFFAIHIILLGKYTNKSNFLYMAFGQFLAMTILSLLYLTIFEITVFNNFSYEYDNTLILALIFTSVISTFLSILLISKYQYQTTPLKASIIYSMESLFASIFAYIILSEILNLNQIVGAVLMIIGLAFSEFYGIIKFKFTNYK